jgi:hypothetical protein
MNLEVKVSDLSIYIVCHDKASYELFRENNRDIDISKFKFILVGDYDWVGESFTEDSNNIVASFLPDNIEKHKTLLTFTAWYSLIKNDLIKTKYVGVFEYDCVFKKDIFELEKDLDRNKLIGFYPVSTTCLYLDLIPEFCKLLPKEYIEIAKKEKLWIASANMILPVWFMATFVYWYSKFIPQILQYPKHPHFHERAVNILAAEEGMISVSEIYYEQRYLIHQELRSHKIDLQK